MFRAIKRSFERLKFRMWQAWMIRRHGWYACFYDPAVGCLPEVMIDGTPYERQRLHYHTHGIKESFGCLDLQTVGTVVDAERSLAMFRRTAMRLQAGKHNNIFQPGEMDFNVIRDMPVRYEVVKEQLREGEREVLRIIVPDPKGCVDRDKVESPYEEQWEGVEP